VVDSARYGFTTYIGVNPYLVSHNSSVAGGALRMGDEGYGL
jgi:hypothetical protein